MAKIGIKAVKPPPKERAIEIAQKESVISVLMEVWKKYPYFRLGQLLSIIHSDLSEIEDLDLLQLLKEFNPVHAIECGECSQSRTIFCTLDKGHSGDKHFSRESGMVWQRF